MFKALSESQVLRQVLHPVLHPILHPDPENEEGEGKSPIID